MRTKSWFVMALLAAASLTGGGCVIDEHHHGRSSDLEIVFGISQARRADGKVVTTAGYEFLDVLQHRWSTYGYVAKDRRCWAEKLDTRLGQPRVEGGVALFKGGLLPAGGVAVVANKADDTVLEAPAWERGGDTLTFESKGFAMPDIDPARLRVPSPDLAITAPAGDATVTLTTPATDELEVAWDPGAAPAEESVVAAFVTEPADGSRGVELRCFFDRPDGKGRFPKALVDRVASLAGLTGPGEVKGKLRVGTHRQLTILADGGWIVYVVATAPQREQPFVLNR